MKIDQTPEWKALEAHKAEMAEVHMRDLFSDDPGRFERFSLRLDGLLLDFSKNRITEKTMTLLTALAKSAEVEPWIARMFAGEGTPERTNRRFHYLY